MRILFLGRKPAACDALTFLVENGIEVVGVVAPSPSKEIQGPPFLADVARQSNIPVISDDAVYGALQGKEKLSFSLKNIDVVISFLFWKKIRKPLILLPRLGCLNFHPAPLPEFRGLGGYNFAIYEKLGLWGAAAHYVNENFDEGDVVISKKFPIDQKSETAFSLEQKTQRVLLDLFYDVVSLLLQGKPLPRVPQGSGRYINRHAMETLRVITEQDSLEEIERKIRAYWFPPYQGATIELKGKIFTVIDENILKQIAGKYHGTGNTFKPSSKPAKTPVV